MAFIFSLCLSPAFLLYDTNIHFVLLFLRTIRSAHGFHAYTMYSVCLVPAESGTWSDGDGSGWADAGETILYMTSVMNEGTVTLGSLDVTDSFSDGSVSCSAPASGLLGQGEVYQCQGSRQVSFLYEHVYTVRAWHLLSVIDISDTACCMTHPGMIWCHYCDVVIVRDFDRAVR